jgi:hypothetical protein
VIGADVEITPIEALTCPELAEDLDERKRTGVVAAAYLLAFGNELGELLVVPSAMLAGLSVGGMVMWFGADDDDHAAIAREVIGARRGRSW